MGGMPYGPHGQQPAKPSAKPEVTKPTQESLLAKLTLDAAFHKSVCESADAARGFVQLLLQLTKKEQEAFVSAYGSEHFGDPSSVIANPPYFLMHLPWFAEMITRVRTQTAIAEEERERKKYYNPYPEHIEPIDDRVPNTPCMPPKSWVDRNRP
jgi:hypothetical protein